MYNPDVFLFSNKHFHYLKKKKFLVSIYQLHYSRDCFFLTTKYYIGNKV